MTTYFSFQILLEGGAYLKPWFVCFPCGYVLCAHCTLCPMDETCSHVALLLYSVNKVKLNEGMQDSGVVVSSTNQADTVDLTETAEQAEKPSRLYVCGICGEQFENSKEDFKEHCNVIHQLVPAEPQTVRRKRKTRTENTTFVSSSAQIQIVNADSIEVYNGSELAAAPEYVDAEHFICDESNVEGPIIIFNPTEFVSESEIESDANVDQNVELIIIEDEDEDD